METDAFPSQMVSITEGVPISLRHQVSSNQEKRV